MIPCLLSYSTVALAFLSLILLLEMLMILRMGSCCLWERMVVSAYSPRLLKERFRFETLGMN